MSERYGREEETRREAEERQRLGPSIDTQGRKMADPRGNDGPRPVGELRAERESRQERGQYGDGAHRRGMRIGAWTPKGGTPAGSAWSSVGSRRSGLV
jgi:hypothetical protein